jgi:two-component system nitrogen regulation sensor histidine kinase NtrY
MVRLLHLFRRQHWFKGLSLLIFIVALLAGATTYAVLTEASLFGQKKEGVKHLFWLLHLDLVLLGVLSLMIGWRIYLLWRRRQKNLYGSKLHIQLVTIFSIVATIPALVMALFAVVFIQFSIQSWFGERINQAVKESQIVAQAYLEEHQKAIRADILGMANDLNRDASRLMMHHEVLQDFINTQAMLRNLSEAVLVNSEQEVIARSTLSFSIEFLPDDFKKKLEQADGGEVVLFVGEQEDRVRALIRLDNYFDTYLFVGRLVDEQVLDHIVMTNTAVDEYSQLEKRQSQLKTAMTMIFLMIAVLLLFVAIWAGLTLAERLVLPIMRLVRASEQIREGDLNIRVEEDNFENELTTLARTFNSMTDQLANQRRDLVRVNQQLDERRRFIEAVLGGVNAGVIGLDTDGTIIIANESAQKLLQRQGEDLIGQKLSIICPEIEKIRRALRRKQTHEMESEVAIESLNAEEPPQWVIRMSADINSELIKGYVATFDDISALVEAQKKSAWADVARRVAHEIKNPLTPIQLSAERLKRRYGPQITEGKETFDLCTDTITRQVDDIRRMVDEFAAFARMPQVRKQRENLVTICQEVLVLFQHSHPHIQFNTDYTATSITVMADRQQLRQALINLIKNAVEALFDGKTAEPRITLRSYSADNQAMAEVIDNGPGWPQDLLPQLMTPYVTTKEHGTGLGLSIVAKILEDHNGKMELKSNEPHGAVVVIKLPLADDTKE